MKTSILAAAAVAALAGATTPASAAQIMLSSNMIIGALGDGVASRITDQQASDVTTAGAAWTGGFGSSVTIDLGQAYDLGRFDFFTTDIIKFALVGGNHVSYNGFGSYLVDGPTAVLATGDLFADAGDANGVMTRQSFSDLSGTGTFRYVQLQISDATVSREYILNELRIFDHATGAVPEPASWALMIGGFALAGASLRRRPHLVRTLSVA